MTTPPARLLVIRSLKLSPFTFCGFDFGSVSSADLWVFSSFPEAHGEHAQKAERRLGNRGKYSFTRERRKISSLGKKGK
ncbi:Leuk-A4-hydro_C domain-containing protein [Psidium guajava]|nr:Leuk-A4-hydro_C domain-containing protein [Psidium guajava]